MHSTGRHEYINNFLYFVMEPRSRDSFIYCSGISVDCFMPITKGRHRPMSNPAIRGLQLVNLGVRSLALSMGATPYAQKGKGCADIVPVTGQWTTERLLIKNARPKLPEAIIEYAVIEILQKINKGIVLGADMPDKLMSPDDLQSFLEGLCDKYGKDR